MRAEWQAHIDELLQTYQEKRRQIQEMQSKLEAIEAEAEAADGMVRVKVDRQGRLTSLELDPRVQRKLGSEQLAEAIMEATRDAQTQVTDQMRAAMQGLAPEGAAESGFDIAKLLPERPDDIDAIRERLGILPR
ncbi:MULTISPECIES: YbaB/EbfC family nucleoid-associated protein [Actinomadura]|uniref:YbaB/EbfC family nucleoid-associated protein n=1 Tax=Actinomadura TaxID=1988 RepID=UPI0003ACDC95|nr:YbaB/EbfC family nucleoid-associated protein [Actinomadura madurae]MCP9950804.1 YbaB/EbfC family nucleoid-associated protein [Actinomadura madurae]MCP9967583.1 YbaB/EbfC family nucleoid-associated protein [Actinomadura madurae]MCP9980033.1 YbaB/EbfC family nucleoid-associated protein [Actinomadura madurae]URM96333.1 YbaB/EbfC family nucleoid-associated protein [Actinomadura madurae]SPT51060.1 DNA-binding protein, YbaB/EbfC family [Actinomadura madurae]